MKRISLQTIIVEHLYIFTKDKLHAYQKGKTNSWGLINDDLYAIKVENVFFSPGPFSFYILRLTRLEP